MSTLKTHRHLLMSRPGSMVYFCKTCHKYKYRLTIGLRVARCKICKKKMVRR